MNNENYELRKMMTKFNKHGEYNITEDKINI